MAVMSMLAEIRVDIVQDLVLTIKEADPLDGYFIPRFHNVR